MKCVISRSLSGFRVAITRIRFNLSENLCRIALADFHELLNHTRPTCGGIVLRLAHLHHDENFVTNRTVRGSRALHFRHLVGKCLSFGHDLAPSVLSSGQNISFPKHKVKRRPRERPHSNRQNLKFLSPRAIQTTKSAALLSALHFPLQSLALTGKTRTIFRELDYCLARSQNGRWGD